MAAASPRSKQILVNKESEKLAGMQKQIAAGCSQVQIVDIHEHEDNFQLPQRKESDEQKVKTLNQVFSNIIKDKQQSSKKLDKRSPLHIRESVLSQAKEMALALPKHTDSVPTDISQIESALLAPKQTYQKEGESSLERINFDVDAKPKEEETKSQNLEQEALKLFNLKRKLQNIQQQQNVPDIYVKQDIFELIDLKASPTGSFEGRQSPMYNNKMPRGPKLTLPSFSKLKLGEQGSDPLGRFKNFSKRAYKNLMHEDTESKEGQKKPLNIKVETYKQTTEPPSNEPTFEPIINIQALRTNHPTKSPSPSLSQSKKHMANQRVKLGSNTKRLEIKTFYSNNTKDIDTQTRPGKNDTLLEGILHTMKTTQSPGHSYGKPKIMKKPIVIETQIGGSAIRELSKNSSFELTGSFSKFHHETSMQDSKPNLKDTDISSFLDMTTTIKIE